MAAAKMADPVQEGEVEASNPINKLLEMALLPRIRCGSLHLRRDSIGLEV